MKKGKKKILVVEDCPSDVFLLQHMLQDGGNSDISIVNVPRLTDAFQKIDNEPFDLILLDLNLLDIDGVAAVAALTAETPTTPLIVYSGMEDEKVQEKAKLCGARSYLVKGKQNAGSLALAINNALTPQYGSHRVI